MASDVIDIDQLIGWDGLIHEDEKLVRQAVRRLAQDRCMPRIVEAFETGTFPKDLVPEFAELGLLGANLTGYGCAGMNSVAWGLACMEVEACDSGLRSFISVQTSLSMFPIHKFGSEAQKQKWLPEMAAGKKLGCFGLTEPGHGSDPAGMETRAVRDGDHWVLTGQKLWITNAQICDLAIVWAKTGEGADSIRGFIVERGMTGFSTGDIPHKLSMRASTTGALYFDEVRVPESNRLPDAAGLKGPLTCLNAARAGIGFGVLGSGRACLEIAIQYARDREQFGVPIGSKQLVQSELADMTTNVVLGSLMALHYARLKDAGKLLPAQVSLLKRNNCRVALDAARRSRAILGANGVAGEYHVMRHSMNLESTYTYEGTDQIHTLSIGRAITGLSAF